MHTIIALKDLRQHMERYAQKVRAGQSFIVVKRSRPIFSINPISYEESWETVIDFTKVKKGGVPIDELLKRL